MRYGEDSAKAKVLGPLYLEMSLINGRASKTYFWWDFLCKMHDGQIDGTGHMDLRLV